MTLFSESFVFDLIAIIATVLIGIIGLLKWNFSYWNRKGLPTLDPVLLFGDAKEFILGHIAIGEQFREFYKKFKSKGLKHGGIYFGPQPVYLAIDPETVKHIMQKDFGYFMNHGTYYDPKSDPLGAHLFHLENDQWRNMRVKLTPTFTSGKMKMMFQTFADCAVDLKNIMKDAALSHIPVDIKDVLARFTTDIIGSVAFGIQCNSLKDPNAEFRKYGRKVFDTELIDRIKQVLVLIVPHGLLHLFGLRLTPRDVEKFFKKAIRDTVNYREKNNIYRKDFMHLLLQLKNRGTVADDENITDKHEKSAETGLTMNELYAQAFVFFKAGFETSSTTMTFALYELATNPNIQDKLRQEINTVLKKHGGKLTYDGVMEMSYMEKVIYETLRKYPPVPVLRRKCNKDYTIPNTSYKLEEGMGVGIPILALHTDPEYYPNPEKFDPERFSEENKASRPDFTWLPFGEGPRLCIGLRFGMVQSKVGLTSLLKDYKIKINSRTKLPLKIDPAVRVTSAEGGVWLDVEKED